MLRLASATEATGAAIDLGSAEQVALHPSHELVAAGWRSSVRFVSVQSGESDAVDLQADAGGALTLGSPRFSKNGKLFAAVLSGPNDGRTIVVVDVESRRLVGKLMGHTLDVSAVELADDGRKMLVKLGPEGSDVRLVDLAGLPRMQPMSRLDRAVLSGDGELVAGRERDGGRAVLCRTDAPTCATVDVPAEFAPASYDRRRQAFVFLDPRARELLVSTDGRRLGAPSPARPPPLRVESREERTASAPRRSAEVIARDEEGRERWRRPAMFRSTAGVSPDGKYAVIQHAQSRDEEDSYVFAQLVDNADGTALRTFHTGRDLINRQQLRSKAADDLRFSRDGTAIYAVANTAFLCKWKIDQAAPLWCELHDTDAHALIEHPSGRFLLLLTNHSDLQLIDAATGKRFVTAYNFGNEDYVWVAEYADGSFRYLSSRNAQRGIVFRIGDKLFPLEQFDLRFNRPDAVLGAIGLAPRALIDGLREATQRRLRRMGIDERTLNRDFGLPEVRLASALPITTTEREVPLKVSASVAKGTLIRLDVTVNGVPLYGAQGRDLRGKRSASFSDTLRIPLANGRNRVSVSVVSDSGLSSLGELTETTYSGEPMPSTLYVVAIGVSSYGSPERDLWFAAKDARDISEFFERHGQRFTRVELLPLLDADVVKERVTGLKQRLTRSTPSDQIVLFVSGHGEQVGTSYLFATSDIDLRRPAERGLAYEALEGLLDGVGARRKTMFIDTCFSGETGDEVELALADGPQGEAATIAQSELRTRGLRRRPPLGATSINRAALLGEVLADLRRGTGALVFASASFSQAAEERLEWGNGAFTKALLEGLGAKADRNADGRVVLSELRTYVIDRVLELTAGRQRPTVRRDFLEDDFPLY